MTAVCWPEPLAMLIEQEGHDRAARTLAADMRIIDRKCGIEPVTRVEPDLTADGRRVLVVIAVIIIAVMLGMLARDAKRAILAEREIERAGGADRVEIAIFGGDEAFGAADPRTRRDDVYRTAGGVAAVERPLWALENLDRSRS